MSEIINTETTKDGSAVCAVVKEDMEDLKDLTICADDGAYYPVFDKAFALNDEKAYVDKEKDIYYPYRGYFFEDRSTKPGIYVDINDSPVIIEPSEEEREAFRYSTHLEDVSPQNIIKVLHDNPVIRVSFPESSKMFIPDVTERDDILKRAIKFALKAKNIDLDACRDRFGDKNQLFNFKSVIKRDNNDEDNGKGSGRLSILLFERGCEALGLKYSIILEEADSNETVGISLNDPEARRNLVRNFKSNFIADDVNKIPPSVQQNFRSDAIDLNNKIIVASDDSFKM